MKGVGIVCEFNPLHNGHKYIIEKAKSIKNDETALVCVLSSDFVQRGEISVLPLKTRAELAVKSGADVVLELPFPFSCMSAEMYCSAAVNILHKSGLCDSLVFGSESGNIEELKKIAEFLLNDDFKNIKNIQKKDKSKSYISARSRQISECLGEKYAEISCSPNNILAIEYLKAIEKYKLGLTPYTFLRKGAGHNSVVPEKNSDGSTASASFIREKIMQGKPHEIKDFVPSYVYDEITENGVTVNSFEEFIYSSLHLKSVEELEEIAGTDGGFAYLIKKNLLKTENYDELFESLKSKSITDSKIRRTLLFCALGVKKEFLEASPRYSRILCVSQLGKQLLRENAKQAGIILAGRNSHIKKCEEAYKMFTFAENASKAARVFKKRVNKTYK